MTDHHPTPRSGHRRWVARGFEWLEQLIYIALGALLGLIALGYLGYSVVDFVQTLDPAHFTLNIVTLLGRLLLVMLIVELLYTVQVSYTAGTLVLEPFLFVGLIAAIRRIFVLTAQFAESEDAHVMQFNHFVIELGALSGLILVLVVALLLLRRSEAMLPPHRQHDDRG
ncbi:phosphate-starvation-inducible PsiE family protein [Salinisphaera sp. Q1T1-3]|uniref:phosphate-starvation-inducible PsiE family protein n=1 Tax=Salinisphaera sp. Q1T1-3 TaxID=2321229 RepID=UPI000E76C196|nr:phosphate-starvation-inducible PsiE family protein [Salinisphaera sp. Q1T1-3]RJS93593.1 hypothetical protein D3260_07905 [Salinisphaera sp. Q1T1-3]